MTTHSGSLSKGSPPDVPQNNCINIQTTRSVCSQQPVRSADVKSVPGDTISVHTDCGTRARLPAADQDPAYNYDGVADPPVRPRHVLGFLRLHSLASLGFSESIMRFGSAEYVMPAAHIYSFSVPHARSHGVSPSTLRVPALARASRRFLLIRGASDPKDHFPIHRQTHLRTALECVCVS